MNFVDNVGQTCSPSAHAVELSLSEVLCFNWQLKCTRFIVSVSRVTLRHACQRAKFLQLEKKLSELMIIE